MLKHAESRCRRLGAALLFVVGLTGCDFEVTNPGPVEDSFLTSAGTFQAVVNGIKRTMNEGYHYIGINTAIRTRELHIAELDTWRRVSFQQHVGEGDADPQHDPWSEVMDARWLSVDAIRRAAEIWDSAELASTAVVAEAYLWDGFNHRLMADFFCEIVFDGGSIQSNDVARVRAEESFTTAIAIATAANHADFMNAGYAGRASIRVQRGDWAGAVADAGMVPSDFRFMLPFGDQGGEDRFNFFGYEDMIRVHTTWHTAYDDYFTATGDPRVAWILGGIDGSVPIRLTGGLAPWTEVPWQYELKYTKVTDPIKVAGGEEMRLVEAENLLMNADMAGAMVIINAVRERAMAGLGNLAPADIDEAWAFLKRERGIDMWIESRRMPDFLRWRANNTPGALSVWEVGGTEGEPDLTNSDYCMPVSQDEIDENQNLN